MGARPTCATSSLPLARELAAVDDLEEAFWTEVEGVSARGFVGQAKVNLFNKASAGVEGSMMNKIYRDNTSSLTESALQEVQ